MAQAGTDGQPLCCPRQGILPEDRDFTLWDACGRGADQDLRAVLAGFDIKDGCGALKAEPVVRFVPTFDRDTLRPNLVQLVKGREHARHDILPLDDECGGFQGKIASFRRVRQTNFRLLTRLWVDDA